MEFSLAHRNFSGQVTADFQLKEREQLTLGIRQVFELEDGGRYAESSVEESLHGAAPALTGFQLYPGRFPGRGSHQTVALGQDLRPDKHLERGQIDLPSVAWILAFRA